MYRKVFIIIGCLLLAWSCSEEKLNRINTNPNNPEEVPIDVLIPNVTSAVPYYISSTDMAWYASVFTEHTAGTYGRMRDMDRRSGINADLTENAWLNIYTNVLKDLQTIIDRGSVGGAEEDNWRYVGIAQVLYAYTMAVTTDMWGQVPYNEALRGAKTRKPEYDQQKHIYADLQIVLDSAISNLDKETGYAPGEEDLIYHGRTKQWQKAAWGLKARLYNHLSERKPDSSAIKALACLQHAFQSPEDDMTFAQWSGSEDLAHQNPWFELAGRQPRKLSISRTFYDLLEVTNDPRKEVFCTSTHYENFQKAYTPALNGDAELDASGTKYSKITSAVLQPTTPIPLLSYVELLFIKAECHLRLHHYDLAFAAYQKAVLKDMEAEGITQEELVQNKTFYNQVLAVPPEDLTLEAVITQKYIALWPFQSLEVYNDWRRTGIPELNNPLGKPPLRFPYPQNERSTNNANVPDVSLDEGVWWDDGTEG